MKFKKNLLPLKSFFLVSITIFLSYLTPITKASSVEERVQELKTRISPKIAAERLTATIEQMAAMAKLSPTENKRLEKELQFLLQKKTIDKFTQSEAHLSLSAILKLIRANYANLDPYFNVVASTLVKEGKYKNTHYVFYHALDNAWRLPQDLYRKLYERLNILKGKVKDFEFIRWDPITLESSAQEFVVNQLKNYGLIDDTKADAKLLLLSTNLALFGNVGNPTECTWAYFIDPPKVKTPKPSDFESLLDSFGISRKYINQLINLASLLKTKEQTLLQIFIPKDIVDYVGYLSFASGMPADKQTMQWILRNIERRKKYQQPHKYMDVFREITQIFKEEQEKNPLFKELLERVEEGDFSISQLLEIYKNDPKTIDNINYLQARLVFTKNILTNPNIGIKFFRYDTISREKMEEYNKKLDTIVDQMIQELGNKAIQQSR